jgi:alginate O-acetyltransferase complex protein AlgI
VVAGFVFYASWDWRFLPLLAAAIGVNYGIGRAMEAYPAQKRGLLWVGLAANLLVLGFFKYFNFFATSAAGLLTTLGLPVSFTVIEIILPIGISFYTLQHISYLLNVYRRDCPAERSLLSYALFGAFFPQLTAGPIERGLTLLPQIAAPRRFDAERFESGLVLLLLGIFKKIVIADLIATLIRPEVFSKSEIFSGGEVAAALYLFALQVYVDFAAYSDMARGSARLLGFELGENFRQPYFAQTVSEFWQRWHISLSSWLRDIIYMPISRALLRRWTGRGMLIMALATLVTMATSGLWHGANWTYVLWGLLLGAYLIGARLLQGRARPLLKHRSYIVRRITVLLRVLLTFHLIWLAWVLFRVPTVEAAGTFYGRLLVMFSDPGPEPLARWLPIVILYGVIVAFDLLHARSGDEAFPRRWPLVLRTAAYVVALLLIAFFSVKPYVPFIYFQF